MSVENFKPQKIYYELESLSYKLGKELYDKYKDLEWIPIDNHNNIPMFRNKSNSEFGKMKKNLIIAIRKTHKYVSNKKISNFLVPYTSSGCAASCLYCYLVCNYNKCSYLRIFVNREQMLTKLVNTSLKSDKLLTFEIGSNSDLILENTLTGNLEWTIENFALNGKGFITFPTKFSMVDSLLGLNHKGKTIIRMSVNPYDIIKSVEFGTSNLKDRVNAINKLCDSGYIVGILIAPVIMINEWERMYIELLDYLECWLSEKVKNSMSIEVIFMTYSYVNRVININAFPKAIDLFNSNLMVGKGRGKYGYKLSIKESAGEFLRKEITKRFKKAKIAYIV